MKRKIYIYTSDISSFIGQNKWDFVTPFERLWKKCDLSYQSIITSMNEEQELLKDSLDTLDNYIKSLDNDLKDKKITSRQYTLRVNKIEKQKNEVKDKMTLIESRVDDIDLTHEKKLEKIIGSDTIKDINDKSIETDEKRNKLMEKLDSMDITEDEKTEIKKSADSYINKTHGTIKEWNAIDMFEKKFGVKLVGAQQFNKLYLEDISKNSAFDWYICGKVDGLYLDNENPKNSYVAEVKNRVNGFFSTLRDYEKTQIQLYTLMLNIPRAKLIEKYQNKLRITEIYQDKDYLHDVFQYLNIFINNFENNFLVKEDVKKKYISKTNEEKQIFIRKLYLNDINAYEQSKFELDISESDDDNDCMIDDLD